MGRRILLVDDEPYILRILSFKLRREGFIRHGWTGSITSPQIGSGFRNSRSLVRPTAPSVEFSIGTSPKFACPRSIDSKTAAIVPTGTRSADSPNRSMAAT